jgi:hypothetical protein
MTRPDLDRFEAMCTGLFGLLSEDNKWTAVLQSPQVSAVHNAVKYDSRLTSSVAYTA